MAELVSLSITHAPNKTHYVTGDRFERYGMVVRANYSDGTHNQVLDYSCSPSSALTASVAWVSVSYGGLTAYQAIMVSNPPASGYFTNKCLDISELGGNPCINAADGSFRIRCAPFSVEMGSFQLSVSLIYSSGMTSRESDMVKGMMRGFRTNFHQFLVQDGEDTDGADLYKYIDGDGYVHTFAYNLGLGTYFDTDGRGLTLVLGEGGGTITDQANNTLSFDENGRLVSIRSGLNPSDVKRVEYNGDGLRKVYDERNPDTFIRFSYEFSYLRWIKVFYEGELLRTYTLNGFMGQITSIDESAGSETRTLYQFSVNDRDRINRFVDCLTKKAYRLTYIFDGGLNDYRFDSLRNGYMENGSFIQHEGLYFSERRIDLESAYGLIQELTTRDDDNIEMSYMIDSQGSIVSSFERDGGIYRALRRDEGLWIPHEGDCQDSISDSRAFLMCGGVDISFDLGPGDLCGAANVKIIGYIKLKTRPKRARVSFEAPNTSTKDVDINPWAYDVWQYFEVPFERITGDDGRPMPISSFRLSVYDEEPREFQAEVANLQFAKGRKGGCLFIETQSGPVPIDSLTTIRLYDQSGATDVVDFSSPFFMTGADLMETVRSCLSRPSAQRVARFAGGRVLLPFGSRIGGIVDGSREVTLFDPSQGGGVNFFMDSPDDESVRTYYRFAADGYEVATRIELSGGTSVESAKSYGYDGLLNRITGMDGVEIRYGHFSDGSVEWAAENYLAGHQFVTNVFYEAFLEHNGRRVSSARSEGSGTRYEYDGDRLSKTSLIDRSSAEISSKEYGYSAYGDEVSSVVFRNGLSIAEEHAYSRPSTSYKTNYFSDGGIMSRVTNTIASRKTAFGIAEGTSYRDIFESFESRLTSLLRYDNSTGTQSGMTEVTVERDHHGNMISVSSGEQSALISYRDNHASRYTDQVSRIDDGFSGRVTEYLYDDHNELTGVVEGTFNITYAKNGDSECISEAYGGESYERESSKGRVEARAVVSGSSSVIANASWSYEFDARGRVSKKISAGSGLTVTYLYRDYHSQTPLGFLFSHGSAVYRESYGYDNVTGKLCDVTCSKGVRDSSYEYDGLGRLTRSCLFGQQKDYVYGDGSASGTPLGRMSMFGGSQMTYDGNGRLSSIGGTPILYDAYGNMTAKGGTVFRWARGTLLSGAGQVSFEYDFRGTRTVKASAGGLRHVYRYIGGSLVWEDVYTPMGVLVRRLRFFYDNDGLCALRVYEGRQPAKDYAYVRNPFGDIVALWADEGIAAVYAYDAWGNCKVYDSNDQENVSASFVGNVNPFRYRSYYYDVETGLYWLSSRYYDPEIGGFISPDSVDYLDPTTINGLNLYTYCGNDPVNRVDPTGHFWDTVLDVLFIGWDIYNLFTNDGYKDWKNWAALGVDVAFAVIPFVTGGGGQVVKLANVSDDISDFSKVTVIGETMTRVKDTATMLDCADNLYDGFKAYDRLSDLGKGGKVLAEIGGKASNVAWLYGKLRSGYKVVDIGIDSARAIRSSSYIAERITIGIWKSRNIWKWLYHLDF